MTAREHEERGLHEIERGRQCLAVATGLAAYLQRGRRVPLTHRRSLGGNLKTLAEEKTMAKKLDTPLSTPRLHITQRIMSAARHGAGMHANSDEVRELATMEVVRTTARGKDDLALGLGDE